MPATGGYASRLVRQHVALPELGEDAEERLRQRIVVARKEDAPPGVGGEGLEQTLGRITHLNVIVERAIPARGRRRKQGS